MKEQKKLKEKLKQHGIQCPVGIISFRSVNFYAFDIVDIDGLQAETEEAGHSELFQKQDVRE